MRRIPSGLGAVAVLLVCVAGCSENPNYSTEFDEDRMDAAIAEAKSTLDTFVTALKAKKGSDKLFSVKKGFKYGTGDDDIEYIWISDVRLAGDGFQGKLGNEPVNSIGVKLGQNVKVARDEVVDWMYMSDGKLQGGYTTVALAYGSPEQEKFERAMGIDWSRYKFLKKENEKK
ncbi:MAG: DUF2314 domain-containing protein [Pirellulales bacterium]|nr:DUF2314 domain-containing protein [Pirellulales bacterium]